MGKNKTKILTVSSFIPWDGSEKNNGTSASEAKAEIQKGAPSLR